MTDVEALTKRVERLEMNRAGRRWNPVIVGIIGLVVLACVILFGICVWPTVYRYNRLSKFPVRIHRLTGEAEMLTGSGWSKCE